MLICLNTNRLLAVWLSAAALSQVLVHGGHAVGRAQDTQDQQSSRQQIKQWISLLSSDRFGDRELADTKLRMAGAAALPHLERVANSRDLDAALRAVRIIAASLESTDDVQFDAARKALQGVAEQAPTSARRLATQALAAIADPKFCQEIKQELSAALAAAEESEEHPIIASDEIVEKLKAAPGFEFSSGNRFHGFDGRESKQPDDHPQVLGYRVRWFASGWSRWFIPGVNDADTKTPDGRMWRYFMDHEYQMVKVIATRGNFVIRDDFLPTKATLPRNQEIRDHN